MALPLRATVTPAAFLLGATASAVFVLGGPASAQAPAGYYASVDDSSGATLRQTLNAVIDDHQRYPYTSGSTDTWDILEMADEDPTNSSRIIDVYKNESYPKQGGGNSFYNREHTWPKSYGNPIDDGKNYPYTDCHQLFLCDDGYNSSRSNKPYGYCASTCDEEPTESNAGQGGSGAPYPGDSNWTSGFFTNGTWETWSGRRGDVARALFYLDVRYEGGVHGFTGWSEPDFILTDNISLIAASNTGQNESVAYMGLLTVLLQWHQEDPVDAKEMERNDAVFAFQGNRNPFIDHPEWVNCIFANNCAFGGDITPPPDITGLVGVGSDSQVDLGWNPSSAADLDGYVVARSLVSGGPYTALHGGVLTSTNFSDTTVTNGTAYFYVVTALDTTGNESNPGTEVTVTPQAGGGPVAQPWINEIHYDNSGSDVGEFVEIAGPAGTSLAGWTLVGYNGNGNNSYKTVQLSGVLPSQIACTGVLSFSFTDLQNGAPDGIALVDSGDNVVQFLSYEGGMIASGGPADGMFSTNIGVSEGASTPVGFSLQLGGVGSEAADFSWQAAQDDTPGTPNFGQVFAGGCPDLVPPAAPSGLAAVPGFGEVRLDWDDSGETDLAGYRVYRATQSGGPYSAISPALVSPSELIDSPLSIGTTFYFVVTAEDDAGNESGFSAEAEATPFEPFELYGCGNAPADSLVVLGGVPSLGETVTFGVDNPLGTQATGSVPVLILSITPDLNFPCGTLIPGWSMTGPLDSGELLVSLLPPNPVAVLVGPLWTGPDSPSPIAVPMPTKAGQVGLKLYFQAVMVDPLASQGVGIALGQAMEVTVGP